MITMMMPSSAKRPARPRELNLRRTSSCSSVLTDQYLPSNCQSGYDDKPEIITEDFEEEEAEEERVKPTQQQAARSHNSREPIAAMQLIHLKQKSRSFHMPPSINVSACEDQDLSQVSSSHVGGNNSYFRKRCPGMRSGSAPEASSSNRLTVPLLPAISREGGVEHISHLVVPDPPCHFCCESNSKPVHEDCTRLKIVSRGNTTCNPALFKTNVYEGN